MLATRSDLGLRPRMADGLYPLLGASHKPLSIEGLQPYPAAKTRMEKAMSDRRSPDGESSVTPIPDDPTGEAQEQLEENDEHLREGDEPTPDETVPER